MGNKRLSWFILICFILSILIVQSPVPTVKAAVTTLWGSFGGSVQNTNGVYVSPLGRVWAVGPNGYSVFCESIYATCTTMTTNTTETLTDVSGNLEDTVYAVGTGGTVLFSNDIGQTWQTITLTDVDLDGVTVLPDGSVYIVSAEGYGFYKMANGAGWVSTGYGNGLWATDYNNQFIVRDNGVIRHFDGYTWITMSTGVTTDLLDIAGTSNSDLIAVGRSGTILHYDGVSWTSITGVTNTDLESVWVSPTGIYTFVGHSGFIATYDGTDFEMMHQGDGRNLYGVSGNSDNYKVVSGDYGLLYYHVPGTPDISSPVNNTFVRIIPTFSGTGEYGSHVWVRGNGSGLCSTAVTVEGTWSCKPASMADGTYIIEAIGVNTSGNMSDPSTSINLTKDTVAPAPPVIQSPLPNSHTNDSTPTVRGTAEPFSLVMVRQNSIPLCNANADENGQWSCDTIPMGDGPHSTIARAFDRADNYSDWSTQINLAL